MTADPGIAEPKRREFVFKLTIGLCVAAVLFLGWLTFERKRGQAALRKYEKHLLAKGEKLTFAELITPAPLHSEAVDRAIELIALCQQLAPAPVSNMPPAIRSIAPAKATVVTRGAEWIDGNKQRIRWDDVASDLESNRVVLTEMSAVLRNPEIRYPVHYRGFNTLVTHVDR